MTTAILWPTFALVALIFAVWLTMFVDRVRHMRQVPPSPERLATSAGTKAYFEPVEAASNNFTNLFEMPVLYFALVPLLLVLHHAGHVEVALAWAYVVLRAVHSLIQIARQPVHVRFVVYLASCVALSAMWLGLAVDLALGH